MFRHLPHRRCVTPPRLQITPPLSPTDNLRVTKQHRIRCELVLLRCELVLYPPPLAVRAACSYPAFTSVNPHAEDIPDHSRLPAAATAQSIFSPL